MKNVLIAALAAAACGAALAKLPPVVLDEAGKAKAAETAARTAWQAKLNGFQLCNAQNRVVAHYRQAAGGAPAKNGQGASMSVAAGPNVAANPAVAGGTAAAPGGASQPLPPSPCSDPGPFAFTPPSQKPLEASGAHSPTGTAISPPSVQTPAAQMDPAKK